ncbi:MAG: hypothetical protein KGJ78_15190 [Alphaproteobacteria bacterium]|nr:hypothetical protein [Alphaproteobacteria bacterium]
MHRPFRIPALLLALALTWFMAQAAAADNPFSVPNVHVDASGSSSSEARLAAIAAGRPVAWQILFRRLTRQQDWARQPMLDDSQLQRLIISYLPNNERRSTTRYVADITYTFNPEAVARVLQAAGIPYTATAAKRILLVPMAPGYARGSLWTSAFASPRFAQSVVPFSVPVGDAADTAVLQNLSFDTATWANVQPVAARIHATEAVLVLAAVSGNKLVVTLRRIGAGELPVKAQLEVPILQGAASTYPAAADAAVRALDDMWKTQSAVNYSQKATLVADVRTDSLAQFAQMQSILSGVPNVSGVTVTAMDIGAARITISYIGTTDQLKDALAQAGLTLTSSGQGWQLSQGSAASAP